MKYNIDAIYYLVDEFCKIYLNWQKHKLISSTNTRHRAGKMSLSEMLTIMIIYHQSPCREFKYFYLYFLPQKHGKNFPNLLSYNRFVEIMPQLLIPLSVLLHCLYGKKDEIYFIDSTKLQICHNKRTNSNRVFKNLAQIGKSSYGWFMGFKLHMIINSKGQIISIKITCGNVDDRIPVKQLTKGLRGSLYADKGYISKELFKEIYADGLRIVTSVKANMKNYFMTMKDKILLRKRSVIESAFNILKNCMKLEHTRHRSPTNFLVNIISCLVSYQFRTNKPKIKNGSDCEEFFAGMMVGIC
jgi:transposase